MGLSLLALLAIPGTFIVSGVYLWHLNRAIKVLPSNAAALSPHRWSIKEIQAAGERIAETPLDTAVHLAPTTGRRYVVVGGAGESLRNFQSPRTHIPKVLWVVG